MGLVTEKTALRQPLLLAVNHINQNFDNACETNSVLNVSLNTTFALRLMYQQQKAVSTATDTKTLNLVLLKVSWEPKLAGML